MGFHSNWRLQENEWVTSWELRDVEGGEEGEEFIIRPWRPGANSKKIELVICQWLLSKPVDLIPYLNSG